MDFDNDGFRTITSQTVPSADLDWEDNGEGSIELATDRMIVRLP